MRGARLKQRWEAEWLAYLCCRAKKIHRVIGEPVCAVASGPGANYFRLSDWAIFRLNTYRNTAVFLQSNHILELAGLQNRCTIIQITNF